MSDSESNADSDAWTTDSDSGVPKGDPPSGVTGLALAENYFGPLLSSIAATPALWMAYAEHRRSVNARYKNVFTRKTWSISDAVAAVETELKLGYGTLQKCVTVLRKYIEWADEDEPGDADVYARIYSPAAPKYVDVHLRYHCRPRAIEVEWFYSVGYKIHNRISDEPTSYRTPSKDGLPSGWHAGDGWQSICWGYYDDDDDDDPEDWRRIEVGQVEVHKDGVLDVHEALFGPVDPPASDDAPRVLEYRRKLVATSCLMLAVVGIGYQVACAEGEKDVRPDEFMLEGLSDGWVARGIRAACGFQLSGDPEAAKLGEEERREEAERDDDEYEEDEDEYSDEGFSW